MKASQELKEPLKIKGSAYSLKNKEDMDDKSKPRLGNKPKDLIA